MSRDHVSSLRSSFRNYTEFKRTNGGLETRLSGNQPLPCLCLGEQHIFNVFLTPFWLNLKDGRGVLTVNSVPSSLWDVVCRTRDKLTSVTQRSTSPSQTLVYIKRRRMVSTDFPSTCFTFRVFETLE